MSADEDQAEARFRERDEQLARLQRMGGVGSLDIDVAAGLHSHRSPEYLRLHGLPPAAAADESHADWVGRLHPEDREGAERALYEALSGDGSSYSAEYRIIRPSDGAVRWIQARADIERDGRGQATRLVGAHLDVTERKVAEQALKDSEARHTFLLKLSDAVRQLSDPGEIQAVAVQLLGRELGAGRVYYVDWDAARGRAIVARDYVADGSSSVAGDYPFEAWSSVLTRISDGSTWTVSDMSRATDISLDEQRMLAERQVIAWVDVPLVKQGELIAVLCVTQPAPRAWTAAEIRLVEDTAERMWAAAERARSEAALRESEMRFRALATAGVQSIYRMSPDWRRMYELAGARILADTVKPSDTWADNYILPEDLHEVQAAIDGAISSRGMFELEHRVRRADGSVGWVLSRAVPIVHADGEVAEWFGAATDVTARKLAEDTNSVLLAELQHRVRNVLAVVRSVFGRTVETASDLETAAEHFRGRLDALARTQVMVTRNPSGLADLETLIRDELLVAGVRDGPELSIEGPDVGLHAKAAEVVGLAIHELTTNALKYGGGSASR